MVYMFFVLPVLAANCAEISGVELMFASVLVFSNAAGLLVEIAGIPFPGHDLFAARLPGRG